MRRWAGACAVVLAVAGGCAAGAEVEDSGLNHQGDEDPGKADDPGADTDEPWEGSTGWGDTDGSDTGEPLDEISEYIFELGHLPIDELVPKTETNCMAADCPVDGQEGEEWCSYVHYEETRHAHDLVAFQPNSATLWPGNVVQGADAEAGILTPIGLPRAPMTFSVSLENLLGSPVGHMEEPSLSSFREQRNEILSAGTDGAVPANIAYDIERVYDFSQVAVSVGGSLDWFGGSLSSMFDFENTVESTKILVDFTQAYYTIDVDTPGLPSDFFTDEVSLQQLENFMGQDNPPMYVQSITYGRRVLFSVESTYTEQEVRFAFEAGFDAFLVGGGVDIETQYKDVLEQSRISALILGGAGSDAVKTVLGFEGLLEYLADGAEYSKESPGAPIAYKLAYLDNSGVKLALSTEYAERQCYDNFVDVTGELARLEYLGGNEDGGVEVFGHLAFRVAPPGEQDPCRADAPGWQRIFDRNDDGAQDVYGLWVPTDPVQKTIYDIEVLPDAQLCMRGRLKEADNCWLFCGDDDFGSAALGPIPLDAGWAGDYVLEFSDEGTVHATVRISLD